MASSIISSATGILAVAMVYYGISSSMASRTEQIAASLNQTTSFLSSPETLSSQPPPLSSHYRLPERNFSSTVKARWNQDLTNLIRSAQTLDVGKLAGESADVVGNTFDALSKKFTGSESVGTRPSAEEIRLGGERIVKETFEKKV